MAQRTFTDQIAGLISLLLLIGITSAFAQDISGWAQPEGVEQWRKNRNFFVSEIQTQLLSRLSAKELAFAREVQFVDREELQFGQIPKAVKEGDRRLIILSTAFVLQCQAIGDASFIETRLGLAGFESRYAEYCQNALDAFHRTGVSRPLEPPFAFAKLPPEIVEKWNRNLEFQKVRQASVMFGLAFIVAHELAHHVLGDVDKAPPSRAAWITAENKADKWASELLSSAGVGPYMGAIILDFQFGMIADKPPIPGATHPPIAERLLFLIQHVLRVDSERFRDQSAAEGVPFQPTEDRWKREEQRIKEYLKRHSAEERH